MQRVLERELCSGEQVVWSQQPRPGALVYKSFTTFLLGIPFFTFAVIWTYGASGGFESSRTNKASWPPWFPMLWGGMFMIVGAGLLLSPLWAYWKAVRTVYAITDQRAILIVAPWRRSIHSFVGQQLVDIHRVEDEGDRGDIVFHREARSGKHGDSYYDVGFLGIEGVREAEDNLRRLCAKTNAAQHSQFREQEPTGSLRA